MELHVRIPIQHGFTRLVAPPQADIQMLEFGILSLNPGEDFSFPARNGRETGIVILQGRASINAGTHHWEQAEERSSVFDSPATAVYLPPGMAFTVRAFSRLEAAVITAPAHKGAPPTFVTPEEVIIHKQRGAPGFLRDVHDIIVGQVPAETLLIGETFNYPGQWSSYPPHKHDIHRPPEEYQLEEIYFYKVDPPQGFGLQRLYSPERGYDETFTLFNNDIVLIPWGYHPVVAAPGYRLYYLWALAGKERILHPYTDPNHRWILESQ